MNPKSKAIADLKKFLAKSEAKRALPEEVPVTAENDDLLPEDKEGLEGLLNLEEAASDE